MVPNTWYFILNYNLVYTQYDTIIFVCFSNDNSWVHWPAERVFLSASSCKRVPQACFWLQSHSADVTRVLRPRRRFWAMWLAISLFRQRTHPTYRPHHPKTIDYRRPRQLDRTCRNSTNLSRIWCSSCTSNWKTAPDVRISLSKMEIIKNYKKI